jgi:threonylcarbamoyladenosine tRNA methylthiotransferase MtaB
MVGFPGESDEAFENSLTFAQSVGLGRVHVFPFSPRKGTRAASMPGQVPRQVVRERAKRAIDISEGLLSSYAKRWVGRGVSVLAEGGHGDFLSGWSRHYLRVVSKNRRNDSAGVELLLKPERQDRGILFCEAAELCAPDSFQESILAP